MKYMLAMTAGVVCLFIMGLLLKNLWTDKIYGDASNTLKNANDYAGQIEKIAYIFTKEGFINLIISISGKFLYLGLASFGMAYFGIAYAVRNLREKKYFSFFILLSTLAAVMISAVYTIRPGRVDALTYGRYQEYVTPVLILMGIRALSDRDLSVGKAAWRVGIMLALEAGMTCLVTASLRRNGQTEFFGNMICGISWLYDPENFDPVLFYWRAYAVGAVLTVIVCMGIWWIGRHKGMEIFVMLLIAVQIVISIRLSSMYIDGSRRWCFRDTLVAEKIQELDPTNDRAVYYSTEGEDYGYIGILQFMMRDTKIHIVKENFNLDSQGERDLLLIDFRSEQAQILEEKYDSHFKNGHFILYYNENE